MKTTKTTKNSLHNSVKLMVLGIFLVSGCVFNGEPIVPEPEPPATRLIVDDEGECPTKCADGFKCKNKVCVTVCGDGVVAGAETCDDGNTTDGDGCSSSCSQEVDPCQNQACKTCGDGTVDDGEVCDDHNSNNGDGCDSKCKVEDGWTCDSSGCTPTCGDGKIKGGETCDDGNTNNGDGCSSSCLKEANFYCPEPNKLCYKIETCAGIRPDSSLEILGGHGACVDKNNRDGDGCNSKCQVEENFQCTNFNRGCRYRQGNGIISAEEACDDGNANSGDGCSSDGQVEEGYKCTPSDDTSPVIKLPITYRKFANIRSADISLIPTFCASVLKEQDRITVEPRGIPACKTFVHTFKGIYRERNPGEQITKRYELQRDHTTKKYIPVSSTMEDIFSSSGHTNEYVSSEFRVYFKYDPKNHDGLVLTFDGDDDYFVYINRYAAILKPEVSGSHPETLSFDKIKELVRESTGNDLQPGEIVELSYFHINRTGNGKIHIEIPQYGLVGPSFCFKIKK